jgi:hypothetical protein
MSPKYRGVDSPQVISGCLTCTRVNCPGSCDRVDYMKVSRPQRRWTPEDVTTLRELHKKGMNDREIAEAMGKSRSAVTMHRQELGLAPHRSRPRGRGVEVC